MPITLNGDTGIQTPMYNGTITANAVTPSVNMKNRIINGAMTIDQRNAGASVTAITGIYTLDRWQTYSTPTSKFTTQQNAGSVTPPTGFTNYAGCTSTSAYSVTGGDFCVFYQWIEGYNVADLDFGKATAKTVTLSFWVRSSLTGTFGGALQNSAQNRTYPFSYTITTANTWQQISVTVAGDTTGTWLTTNGQGLGVLFSLGAGPTASGTAGAWTASSQIYSVTGATSVVGTSGATFYITGVQLEVGSTATSFDYRPFGTELMLCQRYYEMTYDYGTVPATNTSVGSFQNNGSTEAGGNAYFNLTYKVSKRGQPSITFYTTSGTSGSGTFANSSGSSSKTAGTSTIGFNSAICYLLSNVGAWTNGQATVHATISSEL